jgi:hypothetical protein
VKRDRAAINPGGMECQTCGHIFIGEEWHTQCAVCVSAQESKPVISLPHSAEMRELAKQALIANERTKDEPVEQWAQRLVDSMYAAPSVSAQDASPKDVEPVSWAVQLPDGSLSPIGWMDMRQFESAKKFFQLAEGVKYIFAYREPPHD